jgi:serine/threonine protein kinase
VREKSTGKLFAMKVVSKTGADAEDRIRQVTTEKKIIEQLDHPFIIKLYSAFQSV